MGCVIGVSKRLGPARVLVGNAVSTNRDQRWSEGAKVGKTERRRGADGHKRLLGRGGHFNCGGVMVFYPLLAPRSWREWMRSELVQAFIIAFYGEMYGFPITIYLQTRLFNLDLAGTFWDGNL